MRTEEQITADARPGKAFSNGTEWEIWSARWCDRCVNNDEETEKWCPIINVALIEPLTPAEWTTTMWKPQNSDVEIEIIDACTEFEERPEWPGDDDPDGPDPDPDPAPECVGQIDLIEHATDLFVEQLAAQPIQPVRQPALF
jgi:hypothetical protein